MDPRIANLSKPEDCDQLAINAAERGDPELAAKARRRGVEIRATQTGATSDAEREALEAVYAYEAVRTQSGGKKFRANRTWNMIKDHGIIGAIERAVDRKDDPAGYRALAAMHMEDLSFEAVVIRHPSAFSESAVERCRERLAKYKSL